IQEIQRMDPKQLHAMISREAGEDLAQFFMSYSATLIARDPERVLQNGSSLMLMGYLIRTQEEDRSGSGFEPPLAGRQSLRPPRPSSALEPGGESVLAAGPPDSC